MGKNLKGEELGRGLLQKKDGRYLARFSSKSGKRIEKTFSTVVEARNWLDDRKYEDKHEIIAAPPFEDTADKIMNDVDHKTSDGWGHVYKANQSQEQHPFSDGGRAENLS